MMHAAMHIRLLFLTAKLKFTIFSLSIAIAKIHTSMNAILAHIRQKQILFGFNCYDNKFTVIK